jgi:2-polyprenyl-3-methyl-5-hydroxy-6-metoxy-1,4-benzoquinol methylase
MRRATAAVGIEADYEGLYESKEYLDEQVRSLGSTDPEQIERMPTYRGFVRQVRQERGRSLLDVGCGVGRFCRAAHARGWRVTGLDVSERAVALGARAAQFPLRAGRLEDVAARGERFDVVTGFEVLEHLADPHAFLVTARELLCEGGEVFFTVPNWRCARVQGATRRDWLPPVHLSFFTDHALVALLERAGYTAVRAGEVHTGPSLRQPLRWARTRLRHALDGTRGLGLWVHGRRG